MSVKWRNIRILENPKAEDFTPVVKTDAQAAPVPADAKVELVQGGFKFTEGPALAIDGRIFFTDIPNNRIHIYDPASGQITVHRNRWEWFVTTEADAEEGCGEDCPCYAEIAPSRAGGTAKAMRVSL